MGTDRLMHWNELLLMMMMGMWMVKVGLIVGGVVIACCIHRAFVTMLIVAVGQWRNGGGCGGGQQWVFRCGWRGELFSVLIALMLGLIIMMRFVSKIISLVGVVVLVVMVKLSS